MPFSYRKSPLEQNETGAAQHTEGNYTEVLYLSKAGNGLDGRTWETAYTTFADAYEAISDTTGDNTLLMVGIGEFDVDLSDADLAQGKNFDIVGSSRHETKFTNSNASATYIFKFTGQVGLFHLQLKMGTSNNGVQYSGTGTKGSRIIDVYIEGDELTSAATGIELVSTKYVKIDGCLFHGDATKNKFTALKLNGAPLTFLYNSGFLEGLVAVSHTDTTDIMECLNCSISAFATGISIVTGAGGSLFNNLRLTNNTTNIDDTDGNTDFDQIFTDYTASLVPTDLVGTTVNCGVGAGTYGAAVTVVATSSSPAYCTGFVISMSFREYYGVKLSHDGGSTFFWEGLVDATSANVAYRVVFGEKHWIPQGSAITAYAKSVTGGKTSKMWIKLEVL